MALVGRLVAIGLSLLLAVGLLKLLGDALYGAWSLLAVVLTATSVIDFGFPGAVERQIAASKDRDEAGLAGATVGGAVVLVASAAVVATAAVFFWTPGRGEFGPNIRAGARLVPAAFAVALIATVIGAALTGLKHFAVYHAWRTAGLSVSTAAALGVAWSGATRIDLLVMAYAAGSVVTLAGCLFQLRRAWPEMALSLPDRDALTHLVRFGGALQAASLAPLVTDYVFRVLVTSGYGTASAGIYDIAARLSIVVRSLAGALASALVPHSVGLLELADGERARHLHRTALVAIALFTLPATGVVLLLAGVIASALVSSAGGVRDLQSTTTYLLLAHLFASATLPGLMLARAARMPWAEAVGAAAGGIVGLVGIFIWPSLPLAAAWLWLAHAGGLLAAWVWVSRRLPIRSFGGGHLVAISACWIVSMAVAGGVSYALGSRLGVAGAMLGAGSGVVTFVALLTTARLVPAELLRAASALRLPGTSASRR